MCDKFENFEGIWIGEGIETIIDINTNNVSKKNVVRKFEIINLQDNAYSINIFKNDTIIKLIGYVNNVGALVNEGNATSIFYFKGNKFIHSTATQSSDENETITSTTFELYREKIY